MGSRNDSLTDLELAAAIAHEVRRLLTPAKAYAELAMHQPGLPAAACQALSSIIGAAASCDAMLDCLLHMGRGEAVSEVGTVLRAISSDGSVKLECQTDCLAPISPAGLEAVISNLVSNARRADPFRAVDVRASMQSAGNIVIEVRDSGPGMGPRQRDEAFVPFVSHFAGAGIGLALCRALVGSAGGQISIVSTPGHGTTVTVTLPSVRSHKRAA